MSFIAAGVLLSVIAGLQVHDIAPGTRMRLLSGETAFMEAFSRFPNDALNGLSPAKMKRLGQAGEILRTHSDGTVSCRFDDGDQHAFPVEALEDEPPHVEKHAGGVDVASSHASATFAGVQPGARTYLWALRTPACPIKRTCMRTCMHAMSHLPRDGHAHAGTVPLQACRSLRYFLVKRESRMLARLMVDGTQRGLQHTIQK